MQMRDARAAPRTHAVAREIGPIVDDVPYLVAARVRTSPMCSPEIEDAASTGTMSWPQSSKNVEDSKTPAFGEGVARGVY